MFGSRVRTPAAFRKLLGSSERVLAVGGSAAGEVIATQLALWLPEPDGAAGWRAVGWADIVKATWTDGGLEVVEGVLDPDGVVNDLPAVRIQLAEPRNLPSVVRARVENSIARSEPVPVPGGTGRVVARRVPGADGLSWTARLDTETPSSPAAHAALAEYRRRAAATSAELI